MRFEEEESIADWSESSWNLHTHTHTERERERGERERERERERENPKNTNCVLAFSRFKISHEKKNQGQPESRPRREHCSRLQVFTSFFFFFFFLIPHF